MAENNEENNNANIRVGVPVLWIKASTEDGMLSITDKNPFEDGHNVALYSVLDSAYKVEGYAGWKVKNAISMIHGMLATNMLQTTNKMEDIEWNEGYSAAYKEIMSNIKEIFLEI